MRISIRTSEDGKYLEIKNICNTHNHEILKSVFECLPSERKLSKDDRQNAKDLLALKANKKMIQQRLREKTGKCVTLKDLSNLNYQHKTGNSESLAECVRVLTEKYNAEIAILKNSESHFEGLFAQTPEMKSTFRAFPEFLALDGTYKLLKIGVPLYLLPIEDGNCQSEIVAICLLVNETKDNINWFLETFKTQNSCWTKTRCIMTDKDLKERDVLKQLFPNVSIILCIFHTMKTFSREITSEKLRISASERTQCLEILQKMVYSFTDDEFMENYTMLVDKAPKAVVDYYLKNWHGIRNEWSMNKDFFKTVS